MSKNYKTAILITGDAAGGVRAIKATQAQVELLNKSVSSSSKVMDMQKKAVKASQSAITGYGREIKQALGIISGAAFAREALKMADASKQMEARLKLATNSQYEFAKAQEAISEISRKTYSSIENNTTLYARMAIATQELNFEQETLFKAAESLQNSFRVYGTSTEEAASATLQLTQALAKGKLDGDEFRSVMENAPLVMQMLQRELKITKKELFDFSKDGKLQVEDLVNALANSAEEMAARSAEVPATLSESFGLVRNAFIEYIGDADKSTGATDKLAKALALLAENIDTVLTVVAGGVALKVLGPILLGVSAAVLKNIRDWRLFGAQMVLINGQIAATTVSMKALRASMALVGGPFGVAVLAGYAAFEGLSTVIDDNNEKIQKMSEFTGDVKVAYDVLNAEISKGFEADNVELFINSLKTLESELEKLAQQFRTIGIEKAAALSAGSKNDAITQGFELASNFVSGNGFAFNEEIANQNKREQIELIKFQAKANQFLTDTFGPLYQAAKAQAELEKTTAENNAKAVEDYLESAQKQLEKLEEQNAVYGKTASQVIQLEAAKALANTTDEEQIANIEKVSSALIKEANKYDELKSAQKELLDIDSKFKSLYDSLLSPIEALNAEYVDNIKVIGKMVVAQGNSAQAQETAKKVTEKATAEYLKNKNAIEGLLSPYEQFINSINTEIELLGLSGDALTERQAQLELENSGITEAIVGKEKYNEALDKQIELINQINDIELSNMFDNFAAGLNPAIAGLQAFKDELATINKLTEEGRFSVGQQAFYKTGLAAEFALNSMASMAEQGSDAQKKLQAAAAITNTILGITAILEQGKGDPYTAFARMAAMAAMVASMGVQVAGAFGGSSGGGAEQQQATQGTGTVLGESGAKSESIVNALDLIGSISEKILGVNSRMARSLDSMNNAISGTVNQIAQTGEIGNLGTNVGFKFGDSFIDSLLFGGSKITDRGIEVLGGGIADAIDGSLFQAYEIAKRKGLFGSRTRTNTAGLDEGITNQISLIFESMQDAVLAGAEALGVNLDGVQSALDAYQIEEQRISLLDLSPEEQKAELQAVFSSIFDGLVDVSLPFISQFQEAGEGLGETLARVSTTVLVFEEAISSMGLDFIAKQVDPELFAQAAVSIAEFAGGLDSFVDGYTTYVSKFLSESEQLDILTGRISGVFSDIGLELPQTREGFTQLIQSLDLTTASGQEAFGTLIALSGQMDSYYSGLEDAQQNVIDALESQLDSLNQYASAVEDIEREIAGFESSEFIGQVAAINRAEQARIQTLNELAIAGGLAGAKEEDLARSHHLTALQMEQAIDGLKAKIRGIIDELYGGDDLDAQIAELEAQQSSGVSSVANASSNLFEQWERAILRLREYSQSLLLDNRFSPLEADQRLAEAQAQFYAAVEAANNGDLEAANSLTGLANTVLELNQAVNTSGDDYNQIFYAIRDALDGVNAPLGLSQGGGGGGSYSVTVSSELQALYDQQAARNEAFISSERLELALQLQTHVAELSRAINQPVLQLLGDMGVNVNDFLIDLGIITENATAETVTQLAAVARTFGIEVTALADSVDLALGNLADDQSLLNDAVELAISATPDGIREQLSSFLTGIENAADGTARDLALGNMEGYINTLPADIQNALAPYFTGVSPTSPEAQALSVAQEQLNVLQQINHALGNYPTVVNPNIVPIDPLNPGINFPEGELGLVTVGINTTNTELVIQTDILRSIRDGSGLGTGGGYIPEPVGPQNAPKSAASTEVQIQELKALREEFRQLLSQMSKTTKAISDQTDVQERIADNTGKFVPQTTQIPPRTLSRAGGR